MVGLVSRFLLIAAVLFNDAVNPRNKIRLANAAHAPPCQDTFCPAPLLVSGTGRKHFSVSGSLH
jgi:hypothetical protein